MANYSPAAVKEWINNDYQDDGMSFAEAIVITFLYEFLTYDDDDAAKEKLNELLLAYHEYGDETIRNLFTSPEGGPIALVDDDDVMIKVREAIAKQVVPAEGKSFDESEAHRALIKKGGYLFGHEEGRKLLRIMLLHLDEVIVDTMGETRKPVTGLVSQTTVDSRAAMYKMDGLGDDGSTHLKGEDLMVFLSLLNDTHVVSKNVLIGLETDTRIEPAATEGWNDGFWAGVGRALTGESTPDYASGGKNPSAYWIYNNIFVGQTNSTAEQRKQWGQLLPPPKRYYPIVAPGLVRDSAAVHVIMKSRPFAVDLETPHPGSPGAPAGFDYIYNGTNKTDFKLAVLTEGIKEDDKRVLIHSDLSIWDDLERGELEQTDPVYTILPAGYYWGKNDQEEEYFTDAPKMTGVAGNQIIYRAQKALMPDAPTGYVEFGDHFQARVSEILGNGSWDIHTRKGEKIEGKSFTWTADQLKVRRFRGTVTDEDTVFGDAASRFNATKAAAPAVVTSMASSQNENLALQRDGAKGRIAERIFEPGRGGEIYYNGYTPEIPGDDASPEEIAAFNSSRASESIGFLFFPTKSIQSKPRWQPGLVALVDSEPPSYVFPNNAPPQPNTPFGGDNLYIGHNLSETSMEGEDSLTAIAAYNSRIIARLARCYPNLLGKTLYEVLKNLFTQVAMEDTEKKRKSTRPAPDKQIQVEGMQPYDLQCFLIENIRSLTAAQDARLETKAIRHAPAYRNLSALVDRGATPRASVDSDGPSRRCQPGNLISYINHGGPAKTAEVQALLNLCPDAYALLTPYIKVYRVDYEKDNKLVPKKETEIPFPTFLDPKDISEMTMGRYSGVGIESFSWRLHGVNPAEVENNISATLKLRFQTIYDLFSQNPSLQAGITDAPGYLDLIIGSGTSFRETTEEPPDGMPRANPSCQAMSAQRYEGESFRIKVTTGWSTPPGFSNMDFRNFQRTVPGSGENYGTLLTRAIENSRISLYLQIAEHELNFNEDGSVDLSIHYQASLDGILKAPNADIFVGGTEFDEKVKAMKEETKEAYEKVNEYAEDNPGEERNIDTLDSNANKKKEELDELLAKNKTLKYKRFLCNLYDRGNIYMLRIPADEVTRHAELTPKERADLANRRLANPIDPYGRAATDSEIDNLIASASTAISQAKDDASTTKTPEQINRGVLGAINHTELKASTVDIPYFYLGDLLDGILEYLKNIVVDDNGLNGSFQMILGTIEILDPLLAFKYPNVDIDCGPQIGIVTKALADIDPLRFRGAHGLSFYTNIGSLPISLDYFQEWFVNNIVRPQRETYTFLNFVKSLCSSLIGKSFNSKCFGDTLNFNINFDTAIFGLDKSFTGKLVDPAAIADSKAEAQKKAQVALGTGEDEKPVIPSMVLYCSDSRPSVSTSELENMENGIYNYYMGASCGLAKKISFHKSDMPYYREARLQREGSLSATQLRELYNVKIDMIGNTLHRNGQYVKVDPTAIGVGSPAARGNLPNLAQLLGIGGYYLVSSVSSEVSSGGFNVQIDGLQEGLNLGEGTIVAVHDYKDLPVASPKSETE